MRTAIAILILALSGCTAASTGSPQNPPGPSEQIAIFTHCGFYEADFEGELWTPDSIERGDYPEGTGFNVTPGVMTRHAERALFRTDSGIEIWFKLAPADLPPPPPCD